MAGFVELDWKRNRGWPWPEECFGLDPMFGEGGWCPSCGVPRGEQSGSLVLQRRGMREPVGAWVPNWQFDVICLERALADEVAERFNVRLLPIDWHGISPGEAAQLVLPTASQPWYDPVDLETRTHEVHGTSGVRCDACGIRRWLPLPPDRLPAPVVDFTTVEFDAIASQEWFGDGMNAFREIRVRQPLGELLAEWSPRDFAVRVG